MKTAFAIFGSVLAFFGLIGLIGGINGDFESVHGDPIMVGVMWTCSMILKIALYALRHYPEGVVLFYIVAVIVVTHLSSATIDGYKKEFDERRAQRIPKREKTTNQKRRKGKR